MAWNALFCVKSEILKVLQYHKEKIDIVEEVTEETKPISQKAIPRQDENEQLEVNINH